MIQLQYIVVVIISIISNISVVLLGVADANYCLTFADVGCQGRISDGGVLRNSVLGHKLQNNQLNLSPARALENKTTEVPFVFIDNLLKAYPLEQKKGSIKRIFNYRLCRARRVIKNVFGVLPEKATKLILAIKNKFAEYFSNEGSVTWHHIQGRPLKRMRRIVGLLKYISEICHLATVGSFEDYNLKLFLPKLSYLYRVIHIKVTFFQMKHPVYYYIFGFLTQFWCNFMYHACT
nr:unnamed protein product [Callosobruchus analis]